MSALSASFYPPSNRRRCVKGRPSYTEPSDNFVSSAAVINNDHSSDSFNQADYCNLEPIETDDIDEEPITIDLSAFLNENPLLAQSAFECSSENNTASTESSSQFRVTDCEIKTHINNTELPKSDLPDPSTNIDISENVNEVVTKENSESLVPSAGLDNAILASDTRDSVKENCLNLPKTFPSINIINNEPTKEIIVNGKRSPIKKFSKAKPLGLSNPLKKYKYLKTKDLKSNMFLKYPVVECEKLDIENLIKNNKIKISNWPVHQTNKSPKSNKSLLNKNGLTNKKLTLAKSSSKPKLIRKNLNFSKYLINPRKVSAADKVSNILVDSYDATAKSVVIQNDCWKPEITSAPMPTILTSPIRTAQFLQKAVLGNVKQDPIRDNVSHLVNLNKFQSRKNLSTAKKAPFITNVNKVKILPKTYPFIAPKPLQPSQDMTSISSLPKPVFPTVLEPISSDYTVIEPYIDDPSSPVKPKPILTVPVEVIPSPERQSIELHSIISPKNENSGDAEKTAKGVKSVFLNGAIKQISTPTRLKKEISVMKKDIIPKWKHDRENIFTAFNSVSPIEERSPIKEKDISEKCLSDLKIDSPEECISSLQAKNAVVDAMQNVFSSLPKIKKLKPRQVKKEVHSSVLDTSKEERSFSTLNDLFFGFTETDFDDSFQPNEDNNMQYNVTSTPHGALSSLKMPYSEAERMNESMESLYTPPRSERKRNEISFDSPCTSDTLSASEGENECDSAKEENSPKRKLRSTSLSDHVAESIEFSSVCDLFNKSGKSDTPGNNISDSVTPESISYPESNKKFNIKHTDSSLSLHNLEKTVNKNLEEENNKSKHFPYEKDKQSHYNAVCNEILDSNTEDSLLNKKTNSESNLIKSETCTRILRERKCSSTEVDKLSDSSLKQSPHRNTQDKNSKSVKGSINSKLKIQMKTPPRSTAKVKIKRKSCKSDDIIREINTITGGQLSLKKGFKKHKKGSDSNRIVKNSDLSSNKEDSESNSSSVSFHWNRQSHAFLKKKKTLKVHFKRSKKKNASSCLPVPLNSLTDVIENANSTSSVSENNVSLHSSFRKRKAENMGTPCKEENSSHNDTSISEHSMERVETDEKNTDDEHLLSHAYEDSMVNSSETSLIQDSTSVINSNLNSEMFDSSLSIENQKITCDTYNSSEEFKNVDCQNRIDDNKENSILSDSNNEILNVPGNELECSNFTSESVSEENSNNVTSESNVEKISCSVLSNNSLDEGTTAVLSELDEKNSNVSQSSINLHNTDSSTLENNTAKSSTVITNNSSVIDMLNHSSNFELTPDAILDQGDSSENDISAVEEIKNAVLEAVESGCNEIEENAADAILDQGDSSENDISAVEEIKNAVLEAVESGFNEIEENAAHRMQESSILHAGEDISSSEEEKSVVKEITVCEASKITTDEFEKNTGNEIDECSASSIDKNNIDGNTPGIDINEGAVSEIDDKISEMDMKENLESEVSKTSNCVLDEYENSSHEENEDIAFETNESDALEGNKSEICLESPKNTSVSESEENDTLEAVIDNNKTSKSVETVKKLDVPEYPDDAIKKTDVEISEAVKNSSINFSNVEEEDIPIKQPETHSSDPVPQTKTSEISKSSDVSPKKCPKIKISFIKNPSKGSPDNLKNWYVSESNTEEVSTEIDVLKTKISKSVDSSNEKGTSDSDQKVNLDFSVGVKDNESDFSDTAAAVDNSSVGTNNFDSSIDKSVSSPKDISVEKIDAHVIVKEEPMDFEENNESLILDNSSECEKVDIKQEPTTETVKKRGRGRPRLHNSNSDSKSSSTKINESVSTVSEQPSSTKVTPKPRGRKKKISSPVTPVPHANTPFRKKNYVPELVIVPLTMGWMREHVIRATETKGKRQSDIYYFAPDGTKLRSMPEISVYLSKHKEIKLSLENFTFAKELIYREPFEIERDARHPVRKPNTSTPSKKNVSAKTPVSVCKKAKVKHENTAQSSISVLISPIKKEYVDTLSDNTSSSLGDNVRKASKRKHSLSKETTPTTVHEENSSSNCDSDNHNKVRPPRKIVKKIPFDNSYENKLPKKHKLVVQENSCVSNIKIVNVKSVIKENEQTDKPTTISNSQSLSEKSELPVSKTAPLPSSTTTTIAISTPVIPVTTTAVSGNIPDTFPTKRTSEKTSLIQKRLKVKFAPKKSDKFIERNNLMEDLIKRKEMKRVLHKPCTKFCNFSSTRKPSVQCCICLCLFHPECIPFKPTGQTKYACVPCVKTQIDNIPDSVSETFYSTDFDTDLHTPAISLSITSDPNFNAVFNKFYSPVDQSFVKSCTEFNSDQSSTHCNINTVHQAAAPVTRYTHYLIEKNSLDSFLQNSGKINVRMPTPVDVKKVPQTQDSVAFPNLRTGANYSRMYLDSPLRPPFCFYNVHSNLTPVNNNGINISGTFGNVLVPSVENIADSSKTGSKNLVGYQFFNDKSSQSNPVQSSSVVQTCLPPSVDVLCKDAESNHSSIPTGSQSSLYVAPSRDDGINSKKLKLDESLTLKKCSSALPISSSINLAKFGNTGGKNMNIVSVSQLPSEVSSMLPKNYSKYVFIPQNLVAPSGLQSNITSNSSKYLPETSNNIVSNNSLVALKNLTHNIVMPKSSGNVAISLSNADLQNPGTVHNVPLNTKSKQTNQSYETNDTSFSAPVCKVPLKTADNNNERKKRNINSSDSADRDPHSKEMKVYHSTQLGDSNQHSQKENECIDHQSSFWDFNKFSQVYECLNLIFKFLNVSDLLRASLVCRCWKKLATQKFLWENVHFSGLAVTDWNKCCRALQKYGTKFIDFRGIVDQDSVKAWGAFSLNVKRLSEVEEFIFEKVPPFIIHSIADCSSQLKRLTCYCVTSVFTEPEIWSTPCEFDLATLRYLGCLQALKISSMGGIILDEQSQSLLPYLPHLTHLVLTGFKFHSFINLECLSQQQQLITLELGDCTDIEPQIYGLLGKLTNLQNLCLQNGGILNDKKLPEAIAKMNRLENLELMNFQVSIYLSDVLKMKTNLTSFSIWPDNRSWAAVVNFNSFRAATSCTNLNNICWGILTEDDAVSNVLEMKDPKKGEADKLTVGELFETLVKIFPGKNVEVKSINRSIWSEYCSSREFM